MKNRVICHQSVLENLSLNLKKGFFYSSVIEDCHLVF